MSPRSLRVGVAALAVVSCCLVATVAAAQTEGPPPPVFEGGQQFTNLANMPIAGLLERGRRRP